MSPAVTPLLDRARFRLASAILPVALDRVGVEVRLPGGQRWGRGRPEEHLPVIEVRDTDDLLRRVAAHPKIGIGESYTDGVWDVAEGTDLADALTPFAATLSTVVPGYLRRLRRVVDRPHPLLHLGNRDGARRNVEAHYDLSNELFALFLDGSMTYSSALFEPGEERSWATLPFAQQRKIDAALDRARVGAGTRLLEIGTGWGALAIAAARRGAQVTSITLSSEQARLARARVAEAGLADLVDIRVEDYRDTTGTFDAVVSIEMIEAVGEEFWPEYFVCIQDRLAAGGAAVVQAILMDDDRLQETRRSHGWIQKHIFPGGLIPSVPAIERVLETSTSLHTTEISWFGESYADTLRLWRQAFDRKATEVLGLGFDEEFVRTWRFYLAYSEAGFRSRYLDVAQLRFERLPAAVVGKTGTEPEETNPIRELGGLITGIVLHPGRRPVRAVAQASPGVDGGR